MEVISKKSVLNGTIDIPGSKSHTIRAIIIGALADGESIIDEPLDSLDTRSAATAITAFGAHVDFKDRLWKITGTGGKPYIPQNVIDVGNSGTTLYMVMGTASLVDGWTILTGDYQIRKRTAAPLLKSLNELGAETISTRGNGCAPLMIKGAMKGGRTEIAAVSSQYLSSLLLACPLAVNDTEIEITLLNEKPYVNMTLDWLASQKIKLETDENISRLVIKGGQAYKPFRRRVPGDFSSATFLLCAGIMAGGEITLNGLDMNDPQGDKEVINILNGMGADIRAEDASVTVRGARLKGIEVDMNAVPDALPMLSACACFAEGKTVLRNVQQARIKETDRIRVMATELQKLGADIKELPDGLEIRGTGLTGGHVHGYADHRVVMALSVAGLAAEKPVSIDTAEAVSITFPTFWKSMEKLGANLELKE